MKCIALILIGAYLSLTASVPLNATEDAVLMESVDYRLPKSILPSHYELELTPHFEDNFGKRKFTFDGKCTITLSTNRQNIDQIVLHSRDLTYPSDGFKLTEAIDTTRTIKINKDEKDRQTDKLTLSLSGNLSPNVNYKLTFTYTGILGQDMHGFYVSSYVVNGVTKYIGTTQFEQTHARRAFPCFDEPEFKATFQVIINRPSSFAETVSNTKIVDTDSAAGPNIVRETFGKTPKMSTYLLAFVVSEFRMRENVVKSFGVLSRPEAYSQTEYAHSIGQEMLEKFDEWIDYKYSAVPEMTKMHMAALPDFAAGAMENWGLLTFRETALLYDPEESTAAAQQRVGTVIAHEQAHMWFGDLVTCEWWSYTWLNEGFARFFQYLMTDKVHPDWELNLQIVPEQVQAAFGFDSLQTTHPLNHDVNSPSEVAGIFNTISYNKGASFVRMVQHAMGFDEFQAALRQYIKDNEYGLSTPEKLKKALQSKVSDMLNIGAILDTFTNQAGYPVITVNRHADKKTLVISQERFWLKNKVKDDSLWEIPINFASSKDNPTFENTKPLFTMSRWSQSMDIDLVNVTDWIVFNVQETGYYRVNYDEDTWQAISRALQEEKHSGIHLLNRAQIIDDLFNLARADYIDYKLALSIIQYVEKEEHHIPWLATFNNIAYITRRLTGEDLAMLKKYVLKLTSNIYEKLGFDEKSTDSRLDIFNRVNVLNHVCKYEEEDCIKKATTKFEEFETTGRKISVNIRPAVYCTAIAEGGADEFNTLWNKFKNENLAAEQVVILNALGCTKNSDILKKYLGLILSDEVRLQDKSAAFTSTYSQQDSNVDFVFDYVLNNYADIEKSFGSMADVEKILVGIAARITTQQQITKLQKFHQDHKDQMSATTIPNAITDAQYDLKWAEEHVPTIMEYIKAFNGASSMFTISFTLTCFSILITYFVH